MWYVRPEKLQISLRAYAQSDQSLWQLLEYSMIVKLLTEHHLEFLSLNGDCRGLSESTVVKLLEISCRGTIVDSNFGKFASYLSGVFIIGVVFCQK